jgi:hypothetical protein
MLNVGGTLFLVFVCEYRLSLLFNNGRSDLLSKFTG